MGWTHYVIKAKHTNSQKALNVPMRTLHHTERPHRIRRPCPGVPVVTGHPAQRSSSSRNRSRIMLWHSSGLHPQSSTGNVQALCRAVDIVQTAAVWGITHFLRVTALAHAHDLPVSPIGTTPAGLLHAATPVPHHLVSELQDLQPPVGVSVDLRVEDGAYVLGDSPGLGRARGREGGRPGEPPAARPAGRWRAHPPRTRRAPPARGRDGLRRPALRTRDRLSGVRSSHWFPPVPPRGPVAGAASAFTGSAGRGPLLRRGARATPR